MMQRGFVALVLVTTGLLISGCGGSKGSGKLPDPTVRFVNAMPATSGADLLLNGVKFGDNVSYLTSTPGWQDVEFLNENDGAYDVDLRTAGGSASLDIEARIFNRDTHTIVLGFGLPNPNGELTKRARVFFLPVDRKAPTGNRSRLIVFNAMLRATGFETPPITFQSIIPGDPTSIDNPQFKVADLAYASNSVISIDSGSRTFIARRGETDALFQFAETTFTFEPGALYLALITGQESNADPNLQPKIAFLKLETKN